MTAQIADKLRPFGIDYVDAMDRFGDNAELYERLALKYLDDGNLVALQAAMEAKDYSEGYSQAHALKGVAGNLSFKDLYECAALVSDACAQIAGEEVSIAFTSGVAQKNAEDKTWIHSPGIHLLSIEAALRED